MTPQPSPRPWRSLAADPAAAREMGRRGAEFVRREHSWAARAGEIDRVLRAALAGAGAGARPDA